MDIKRTFDGLRAQGLQAKNPDQSAGMMLTLQEAIEACRWKGFSEDDIQILFNEARTTGVSTESVQHNPPSGQKG